MAYQLAQRVRHMRFFRDQIAARRALASLATGRTPDWVRNLDALVIDEVQDLTLLQIACLTELVRAPATTTRRRCASPWPATSRRSSSPAVLTGA
ncbi:MAG: hypothetical protein R2851_04635 [Caldilineaceae bacterium]